LPCQTPDEPFEEQIVALRDYLLKFARLQLRNDAWAEDAVSDTLLAALAKPQSFGNRSQLKTWLVGILKHKLVDALRHTMAARSAAWKQSDDAQDPLEYIAFKTDGHFVRSSPPTGATRSNNQQPAVLCHFGSLRQQTTRHPGPLVFDARVAGAPAKKSVRNLLLTPTNLYVQLHRARLRLRECLELNWFMKGERMKLL
jgi:RNA polymerase sigma-70 factor (TIGR02943 family)